MDATSHFAICIGATGDEDLEAMKVYRLVEDPGALRDGYLRVVDESGEDYLYPREWFLQLPLNLEQQLESLALSRSRI